MARTVGIAMIVLCSVASVLCSGESATQPATQPAGGTSLDLGNGVSLKLVLVPAGKFLMGSPSDEKNRSNDEGPQREVTIRRPFYLAETPVTLDQFTAFVKDSGYQTEAERTPPRVTGSEVRGGRAELVRSRVYTWRNPGFEQKGDHPVVRVSWNDAQAFCDWLSKKSGRKVHLPTEAQWEYACRAGTKTAYPWGGNPDDGKGWANGRDQSYRKMYPKGAAEQFFNWDDGFVNTSPVGTFRANAFGLRDMVGNVWQWCGDYYEKYGSGAAEDPTGPDKGSQRVLRGGAYVVVPWCCRSAARSGRTPTDRNPQTGFRIAVTAGE
ncbi:MAG TPA: DNA recombination protein RecF [Phycisphaerales bacterium]|nr:DNA recombination protein RecF [Phycisphaerales bacterium]